MADESGYLETLNAIYSNGTVSADVGFMALYGVQMLESKEPVEKSA